VGRLAMKQSLTGVEHLHKHHYIHMDLKGTFAPHLL
jgi:serine/threonine protein kinase